MSNILNENELEKELTQYGKRIYKVKDYLLALREIGIKAGDTVCIHSQLFGFGMPLCNKDILLDMLCKIFMTIVGPEGTVIMPAFSYSFCKKEIYNIETTPSTVGLLTEHFRNYSGVKRTKHPIFSFSVWGKRQEEFLDICWDAFDLSSSVYGKMIQTNDKIVLFGAPKGYTFYYLAEQAVGVKHRYFKNFDGYIVENGKPYYQIVPYYVRHLDMKSAEDENTVDSFLAENNLIRTVNIGSGSIRLFKCKEVFEVLKNKVLENEEYFLA